MAGRFQRHQSSLRISVLLLGIAILWAETVTAQDITNTSETYGTYTYISTTDSTPKTSDATSTQASSTQASSTTTDAATTKVFTTMAVRVSPAKTNMADTSGVQPGHNRDEHTGSDENNTGTESTTQKIGSTVVAGLCLIIVAVLLIAVNGYVFFKSRMGSCTPKSGTFHILPMSVIKKDEDDVEDNFKEDADAANKTDSSTSLTTKDSPADQAAEQNGEVHVKVEITEVARSSTKENDDGEAKNAAEDVDEKDAAPAAVVDESDKPEEGVEKKNETVVTVTVEGSNRSQNEQA